jgi:hypothetical protein
VETRTVEEEWYRTEVPGTRKEIPIGHVLNKERGNLEPMEGTAVTLANADALLQNNLDMLVALRNSQVDNIAGMDASTGIQNDDAISLVGGTLGDLARQAKGLEEYLSAAATANAGNITGAKFGELAAIEGLIKARASGVNGTVGNTVKDYATARAGQIGAMLDSIFGTTGDAREGFDKWFDLYRKGQYLITRDWPTEFAKEGANAADRIQYPNGHLVDTNDKGIMGAGLVAAFAAAGEDIDDISHNSGINGGNGRGTRFEEMDFDILYDFLRNKVEPELQRQIISALGIGGVTNAEILAMALVYQLGDGAEYGAFIDDLVAANDKKFINVSDILNGNFTFSLTTQSRSQSAGVRLARVGAGFDFPTESIKGAYGAEYTGAFTPYRKDEQIV